jgi:hypothetical protein
MRLRRISAAAAISVLGGLAVLGSAPAASATAPTTPPTAAPKPPACLVTTSLTGLAGDKLTVGGAPVAVTVTFTNVTDMPVKSAIEALLLGRISAKEPSTSLLVEEKTGGVWKKLDHLKNGPILFLQGSVAASAKAVHQLRISAPAGTEVGADYTGVALAGPLDQAPSARARALAPTAPTNGTFCNEGGSASYALFSVVKAAPKPTTTPTPAPTGATSASTAPPSAAAGGPGLATTGGGSDTGMIAGIGGALVVAGAAGVVLTRRRRGAHN